MLGDKGVGAVSRGLRNRLFAYEAAGESPTIRRAKHLADMTLDGIRLRWEPRAGESSNRWRLLNEVSGDGEHGVGMLDHCKHE